VHLGFAYQNLERPADAAQAFGRATTAGEPDAEVLGFYIDALLLSKDPSRAIEEARAARVHFPKDTTLALLEARAHRETGHTKDAESIVRQVRQGAPGDAKVLAEVADYYRRGRLFAEAELALVEARAADPRSVPVLFQLGAVLERQKRHDEAEAVFREALGILPDAAPVMNYLGYMNADRNVKVAEALEMLERALALDPENGAYLDSLGWAQYRLGRLEEAEANVRKAMAQQPKNAVILDHLGDILKARGRADEAVAFWQKALEGEDEEEELDRPKVERKIGQARSAQDGGASR
jgi:tetratricopeptide (TPR) repeat protein